MFLTALWTWLSSKLSFKAVMIFLVLAAIVGGCWYGYDKLYDRAYAAGVASQSKTISDLQTQLKTSQGQTAAAQAQTKIVQGQLATYVKSYNQYVADTKAQEAQLAQQQAAIVAGLNTKLSTLNKQLASAQQEFNNALPTLLPTSVYGSCDVPYGIIQLYNDSLTGTDSSGGFSTAYSIPADALNPSGVSCSTFAGFVINNNLAAYNNRSLVIDWQVWYTKNEAVINSAIAAGKATPTPVAPPASTVAPAPSPAVNTKAPAKAPASVN